MNEIRIHNLSFSYSGSIVNTENPGSAKSAGGVGSAESAGNANGAEIAGGDGGAGNVNGAESARGAGNTGSPGGVTPALHGIDLSVESGAFVVLCGQTGCGKTTLLKQLVPSLTPQGIRTGEVLYRGIPVEKADRAFLSRGIGFVQQQPERAIASDKVWHELAFGLENLGVPQAEIRRRVAETASFFGMETWFHRDVRTLSGGQKQLLSLASLLVMRPSVILLDEPLSRLDPIAAEEFVQTLAKINRETGTAIVAAEHALGGLLPLCTRVIVMEDGGIRTDGAPREIFSDLHKTGHAMAEAMPAPVRIFVESAYGGPDLCPLTVGEGRQWLARQCADRFPDGVMDALLSADDADGGRDDTNPAIRCREIFFKYGKNTPDVLKGVEMQIPAGRISAVIGGNGAGKSTLIRCLAGLEMPYSGKIRIQQDARVGTLLQDPQAYLSGDTVAEMLAGAKEELLESLQIQPLLNKNPYDLSGGEIQRAAIARVLMSDPDILLLDEPTKGLDAAYKKRFGAFLRDLRRQGRTIVLVSHDMEFCAAYADRIFCLFDGEVFTEGTPREIFTDNRFYTTETARMTCGILEGAILPEEVIRILNKEKDRDRQDGDKDPEDPKDIEPGDKNPEDNDLKDMDPDEHNPDDGNRKEDEPADGAPGPEPDAESPAGGAPGPESDAESLADAVPGSKPNAGSPADAAPGPEPDAESPAGGAPGPESDAGSPADGAPVRIKSRGRQSRRTILFSVLFLLVLVPATIGIGMQFSGNRTYLLLSLLVLIECFVPFLIVFEKREMLLREIVMIAVLAALAVAGRAVFYMLPEVKPVLCIVLIAAVSLGANAGFITGALAMLVSNIFFGQGLWTPWQMFAMGICGFFAGLLFYRNYDRGAGVLRRRAADKGRLPDRGSPFLKIYGFIAALVIYGFIMNFYSALMSGSALTPGVLLAYLASGFPLDLVHAIATVAFLMILEKPLVKKIRHSLQM